MIWDRAHVGVNRDVVTEPLLAHPRQLIQHVRDLRRRRLHPMRLPHHHRHQTRLAISYPTRRIVHIPMRKPRRLTKLTVVLRNRRVVAALLRRLCGLMLLRNRSFASLGLLCGLLVCSHAFRSEGRATVRLVIAYLANARSRRSRAEKQSRRSRAEKQSRRSRAEEQRAVSELDDDLAGGFAVGEVVEGLFGLVEGERRVHLG